MSDPVQEALKKKKRREENIISARQQRELEALEWREQQDKEAEARRKAKWAAVEETNAGAIWYDAILSEIRDDPEAQSYYLRRVENWGLPCAVLEKNGFGQGGYSGSTFGKFENVPVLNDLRFNQTQKNYVYQLVSELGKAQYIGGTGPFKNYLLVTHRETTSGKNILLSIEQPSLWNFYGLWSN